MRKILSIEFMVIVVQKKKKIYGNNNLIPVVEK